VGHVAQRDETRNALKILFGKREGKRQLSSLLRNEMLISSCFVEESEVAGLKHRTVCAVE
jgi:hypothetical protein